MATATKKRSLRFGSPEYKTSAVTNPPAIPPNQAPLEAGRLAMSNTALALLVGPYDGFVVYTTYDVTPGDEGGGRWEWTPGATSSGSGWLGSDPSGRWKKVLDPIGGTGDPYTTYVVPGNSVVGNDSTDDRGALNTLANTTITSAGGQITFASGTYRIASNMTFPAKSLLFFQQGAVLKPDASVVVTIDGDVQAGAYQIFDTSASGSRVVIAGRRSKAEWWGAKVGASASAARAAFENSLYGAANGAELIINPSTTSLVVDDMINVDQAAVSGLRLRGPRISKNTTKGSVTTPGAILSLRHSGQIVTDISLDDIQIYGNSSTASKEKAIQFNFAARLRADSIYMTGVALEGLYCDGPPSNHHWWVSRSYAEDCSLQTAQALSCFNINADNAFVFFNAVKNSGRLSEHTGDMAVYCGNVADGTASGATAVQIGSTTYPNKLATIFGHIVRRSGFGISAPTDSARSLGGYIVFGNVLNRIANAIGGGSKPSSNQPTLYAINHITNAADRYPASPNTAIVCVGGSNVVQNNLIASPIGTTTGTIGSGTQTTMTVPNSATDMHGLYEGMTFTVAGITGTKTVTNVSADKATITFTPSTTNGPVTNAAVTFQDTPFIYLMRSSYDDEPTIEGNVILDVSWTGTGFRFAGFKFTLTRNIFNPRGASYGVGSFIQIVDVGGGIGRELSGASMDLTKDWTISHRLTTIIFADSIPDWNYKPGDLIVRLTHSAAGYSAQRCLTGGTKGTIPSYTAATTIGTKNVTLSGGAYPGEDICIGDTITIVGEYGGAGVVVTGGTGNSITVDTNATVGVSGAAVAYKAPTFKGTWLNEA